MPRNGRTRCPRCGKTIKNVRVENRKPRPGDTVSGKCPHCKERFEISRLEVSVR
jgi:hypothetical protein